MTNYYIEQNNQIVLFDEDKQKLQNTVLFMPQYSGLEIKETERPIVDFQFADTDEYEQEQAQKEAERIARLNLTRGDVFRGLLLAKGITKTQISQMIEAMPASSQEEIVTKELALIDFEDALNFYRGNQLIDTIGLALGITSKQLDKFFETGTSEDTEIKAAAYKYLTNVTLTINPTPVDAAVTINGTAQTTVTLPYGDTAEYSVTADGYLPQSGAVELTENTTLEVVLEEEPAEETDDNGAGASNPPADDGKEEDEDTAGTEAPAAGEVNETEEVGE